MADAVAEHRDRLRPVTCLRFDDLDWTVREMTRMRERGSRAFLVSGEPVGDIPPNHHDFDKVWAAATDLGMVALSARRAQPVELSTPVGRTPTTPG